MNHFLSPPASDETVRPRLMMAEADSCVRSIPHSVRQRTQGETSREAFHSLSVVTYLQPREAQVLQAFRGHSDTFTRQQLVDVVGMPLNA